MPTLSMSEQFNLCENSKKYEIKEGQIYVYGTAGFRMNANEMKPVAFRVGLLAALMSASYGGRVVGVMVTASHNPIEDNGVKMIDPEGEMVVGCWEEFATELANTKDSDLKRVLSVVSERIGLNDRIGLLDGICVAVGRDTRPSGIELVEVIEAGVRSVSKQAQFINLGLQTTPQCHFNIKALNSQDECDYFEHFAGMFEGLLAGRKLSGKLVIDAANGIGALSAEKFRERLRATTAFDPIIVNTGREEGQILNFGCGADYVKIQMKPPEGIFVTVNEDEDVSCDGVRYASLDGDADRLIYFYFKDGEFRMLDGDRISVLFAVYLRALLQEAGLFDRLRFGVVQTAYANGASTAFLKSQGIPVSMACTGVKNLHHVAGEEYDIGVYFEANGHGTVLFNEKASRMLDSGKLSIVRGLINQCVGDAMSDLLLVEAILCDTGLSLSAWEGLYIELPSRQLKVKVADRFVFKTTLADTKLTHPPHIQPQIDAIVAKYPRGRAFVRPSGTEDVVRIYAEAESREQCDELAERIANLLN